MLSLLQGSVYAEDITTSNPNEGIYDKIFITDIVNESKSVSGLEYSGKDIVINDGGSINLQGISNVYGIAVKDNTDKAGYLTVNGKLVVNITNTVLDKFTIGIWSNPIYDFAPGVDNPEYKGGTITLDDTDLNLTANGKGYGLVAGSTFGNNSAKGGHIVSNGYLNISLIDTQKTNEQQDHFIGVLAFDEGVVEINGDANINVSGLEDGEANHEIAGLYSSHAGQIISESNSNNIEINVTGSKIYGISTGYYDQLVGDFCQKDETQDSILGKSKINLKGHTVINLNSSNTGYGVQSSMKGLVTLNDVTVNFNNNNNKNNYGLMTKTGGVINANSVKIGTEGKVKDPTKIVAVNLYGKTDLFGESKPYGNNAGKININQENNGIVQINGKIRALDNGIANIKLSNENSYLYGNTQLNQIYSTSGEINLDINSGGKWINLETATDNASRLTTLNLSDNGLVDLTDKKYNAEDFQSVYVDETFNGNGGIINMDINAEKNTDNSDRVYVGGIHSGTHYITLNNIGSNIDGAEGTVLVSVKNEQGNFKANNSEGTLYWNRYELGSKESTTNGYKTDWYLKEAEQIDEPTTSVDTILGENALGYHTWRAETDKLMKRIGDLRHNGEDEKGAWFRVRGAEISRDGEASFENKYTVYELGYDEITKKTDRVTRYQGAALSYIDGSSSFARGSGENSGKSIAFYTTEMRNKGHYLDLVFRIADMDSDYTVYDTNSNKITGETENVGVSLSAEYGRKKVMDDNGWYIEPQGQLTVGYFGGDNYRAKYANDYINVHQSGIPRVLGRIGFNIGRDIDENTNIYLKANLLHEFCGDYDIDMVDSAGNRRTESDTFNDTWFEYGIGAAIKTGKNNHLYFDFEKTAGGDFEKDWAWNAGMRWTF